MKTTVLEVNFFKNYSKFPIHLFSSLVEHIFESKIVMGVTSSLNSSTVLANLFFMFRFLVAA